MKNDRDDFLPERRREKLWSGDSRRIAKGDVAGVVLEKLGRVDPPDLSHVEAVQMGHRLQPVVARIFEEHHGVKLRDLDVAIEHKTESFIASHFDYEFEDRSALVECKAYNASQSQYFDDDESAENPRIPAADYAQCLHEAMVYGCDTVWLAVLFGGQRFRSYKLTFTSQQKIDWLERLAQVWAMIKTETLPPASTGDDARAIWPSSTDDDAIATAAVEQLCEQLVQYKTQIKQLEDYADAATAHIQNFMKNKGALVTPAGKILATWKTAKSGGKRFDAKSFEQAMPDVYKQFLREQPGSRRFLIKS